jgi:diguanylate cyclase
MIKGLFINFCILIALTFFMTNFLRTRIGPGDGWPRRLISLATMAASGVVLLQFPVRISDGVFLDLRSVLPALAGFAGGPLSGLLVALALSAYRIYIGGAGMVAGSVVLLAAGLLGGLLGVGLSALTRPTGSLIWRALVIFGVSTLAFGLVPGTGGQILRQSYPLMVAFYTAGFFVCLGIFRVHYQADKSHREMERIAQTDPLTSLLNMRTFESALNQSRSEGPAYLLIFDLDRFKLVNDMYGHIFGNEVLVAVAGLMRSQIRACDLAFRYGGEEFAVVLRNCSAGHAILVAERLRAAVSAHSFAPAEGQTLRVTISGGLVPLRADQSVERQVGEADALLYQAKAAGRNRILAAV